MSANKIDFVIVLEKSKLSSKYASFLLEFIRSLQISGIECDLKQGNIENNYYVTVFVPPKAMTHFANIYNIEIDNSGHLYIPYTQKFPHLFETPYSDSNWSFQRMQDGISNMERILITTAILNDAKFGTDDALSGLDNLLRLKAVKTAFPLHDGPLKHDPQQDPAEFNDRQLLEKYWGSFGCWYKEQPLNLIQKYYGCEVAFYFAWLGFYIKMLVPAAILGFICFMIGLIRLLTSNQHQINDICFSDLTICPICHAGDHCVFQKLRYYCIYAKLSFLFDNPATVAFAIIMSFWATVFMNRWNSYESVLKLRWNVDLIDTDTKMRLEYRLKAKKQRLSPVSGELEPYIPPMVNYVYIVLTYATCIFLILIVIGAVCGVILYRIAMASLTRLKDTTTTTGNNISFLTLISSAVIQVIFIKIFSLFYSPLSIWLTKLENPRTQSEFDYSVVYKRFFLAFANNYSSLFYIAFLKGSFYTPQHEPTLVSFETDICSPSGCVVPLCIQLGFLMVLKSLVGNVLTLLKPYFWRLVNYCRERKQRQKNKKEQKVVDLFQFEEEYKLHANEKYELVNEYMEMIIQYGFVTFFVASFPLAPLCALINNAIELRLDAIKFTKRSRRVVPRQTSGIGPWNGILSALTHMSIATNAFVIAFTSDFVIRQLYRINHGTLVGYLDSILSEFDMKDHYITDVENATTANLDNATICHYRANRYPPGHAQQYKLTTYFWYEIGIRLLAVIIFEHAVVFLNGLLSFVLPKMPHSVKEFLNYKRTVEKDIKLNLVKENELKMKVVKRTESNTKITPSKLMK